MKFTIQGFTMKQVQIQMTPQKEQDLSLRDAILETDKGRGAYEGQKKKKKKK
tara:strand:+ start:2514 stop:2669 length:156 start_codon:yes stop_codon:yes gene_type:complete